MIPLRGIRCLWNGGFESFSPRDLLAVGRRLRDSVVYADALLLKWRRLEKVSDFFIRDVG